MTQQEVEVLIQQGEGYNVEFKQSIPSKASDLADEVCAFANAAGGVIIIGVTDKGAIVGVNLDNTTRSRLQNVLNAVEPHFQTTVHEITLDGKTVLCIECPAGKQKPYTVSGSIIIRNGPNSEKITSVERMREFFQQSDRIFFDEVVCRNFAYPDDFNTAYFQAFLDKAGITARLTPEQLLRNLRLINDDNRLLNGAVLFFARDVQYFFDHATIRCLLFKGTDKRFILDSKEMKGHLVEQYEEAMKYLTSKLNLRYEIENQKGGRRKEVLEIPDTVFREALINSLCHRDYYEKGAVTMVEIYDDRVVISNPGGLVSSIPQSEFGTKSLSRNPLVFGLMQRIDLVEKVGSGINRMRDTMREAGLPDPVFSMDGFFTVTFYRPMDFEKWLNAWSLHLPVPQVKILQAVHENGKVTKPQLSDIIGQGKTSVDKHIASLRKTGVLSRLGSDKTGQWVVNLIPAPEA
jgi:ATP-dependent DNA helicase RecG